MAITRSTASQKFEGNPPWPGWRQMAPRCAVVSTRIVIHTATPATTQAPNRSSHCRTTRTGPLKASVAQTKATTISHSQ